MNIKSRMFPEGTVVKLSGADYKLMIVGLCQREEKSHVIYDYVAVPFPQGYLNGDNMHLFNDENISEVFHMGYLDDDVYDHMALAFRTVEELRKKDSAM